MSGVNYSILRPEAKIQVKIPNLQDWACKSMSHSTPVFLASQKVYGILSVTYRNAAAAQHGDYVLVKLTGIVETKSWLSNHPCGEMWETKPQTEEIINMAKGFVIHPNSTDRTEAPVTAAEHHLKFFFQACGRSTRQVKFGSPDIFGDESPYDLQSPSYSQCHSVPSTAHTRILYPRSPSVVQDHRKVFELGIGYKIRAFLLRPSKSGDRVVSQAVSEITILDDSHGLQPPTCVTDFRSEYRLIQEAMPCVSRTEAMKQRILGCKQPKIRLVVRASEPPPLVLRKQSQHATTSVAIFLELPAPSSGFGKSEADLPYGDVCIGWRLQKSTYCSLQGLKRIPTVANVTSAGSSTPLLRKTTLGCSREYKYYLNPSQWQSETRDGLHIKENTGSPIGLSSDTQDHWGERDNRSFRSSISEEYCQVDQGDGLNADSNLEEGATSYPKSQPLSADITTTPLTRARTSADPDVDIKTVKSTLSMAIPLPINIPTQSLPVPTSFTSYVAVRYSLKIHVSAALLRDFDRDTNTADSGDPPNHGRVLYRRRSSSGSSSSDYSRVEAHLEVPVQIVYDASSAELKPDQLVEMGFTGEFEGLANVASGIGHHGHHENERMAADILPSYWASIDRHRGSSQR